MPKTILITGASSGFGRDTAETLHHAGHTVYASMRGVKGKNLEAADGLRKLGIKTVELDVRDDASVEAAVEAPEQGRHFRIAASRDGGTQNPVAGATT